MSKLASRIAAQPRQAAAAAAGNHPAGNADTPMVMPMVRVQLGPAGAAVEQLIPLVTANGAMIPATAPGSYGQVMMTGNARH